MNTPKWWPDACVRTAVASAARGGGNVRGLLYGDPTAAWAQEFTYSVTGRDGDKASVTFTVTVTDPDLKPVLEEIEDRTVREHRWLEVELPARDGFPRADAKRRAFAVFWDGGAGLGVGIGWRDHVAVG